MLELPWMLAPPSDFNQQCSDLISSKDIVASIKTLASYALTLNQCNRLVRHLNKLPEQVKSQVEQGFSSVSLGIVSNATYDLITPAIQVAALRRGIFLKVTTADFDQVAQEAFDPDSVLNQSKPNLILIALDYRSYPFASQSVAASMPEKSAQDAIAYLDQVARAFEQYSGATTIVQSLACPAINLMGNIDRYTAGSLRHDIITFNHLLAEMVQSSDSVLFDVELLASELGTAAWFDDRQWLLSRVPMANNLVTTYAEHLGRLIGALRGKSKKCLVLDLDNTLWGGVIGDDGMDGIAIQPGSAKGESHLSLQRYALELKSKGIILAVCSKNDHKNAIEPFQKHRDMILKESDIAVFVANWQDKASNLKSIAATLNIGIDALVFVDDNPAEREIIRQLVPEVSVPELPKDPALYTKTLSAAGYFELISFTSDDAKRAQQYADNAKRAKLLDASDNLDNYLASLDMEASLTPFDDMGKTRITQLINKTNQFNLTTRRYTEKEVTDFQNDSDVVTLQIRLKDKFGDNGMISVVVCKPYDSGWEIDSWLMSCRVIKRQLEYLVCDQLVELAKARGIDTLTGIYLPTEKNSLVKTHYKNLGFSPVSEDNSREVWQLNIADYKPKNPPIKVVLGHE